MTTIGGDWKDLLSAATRGDLVTMNYHLNRGIDPNFQHPEFFTTPLLEAIKVRQREAVKLLLEHPVKKADPTLAGDLEGITPMEEAMNAKDHDIVDMLLNVLPEDYEKECLTVWMTTCILTHRQRDLVSNFLGEGHCVLVTTRDVDECKELEESVATRLRAETGNQKLWIRAESALKGLFENNGESATTANGEWRPSVIDVWVHAATPDSTNLVRDFASYLMPHEGGSWRVPFRGEVPKVMFLMDSIESAGRRGNETARQQLAYLLKAHCNENRKMVCCAMLEPSTWWERMAYSFGYQKCFDFVISLLVSMVTERGGGYAKGTAFTYNQQSIHLPSLEGIESSVVEDWERELKSI
eukprot:CAMPEP_0197438488 /NCGR_PEP_ID=MMETSP1175-20131217/5480_1 /TAXON_ID=1003142 /ORGANISM="Triceratium dubium, Strain CCMP147" /LENGTH=354 /DNA_ID=CAMNT_0042968235 /DNA_START=46 /DNA_END=1110 /DNA_ORIENTATION=-